MVWYPELLSRGMTLFFMLEGWEKHMKSAVSIHLFKLLASSASSQSTIPVSSQSHSIYHIHSTVLKNTFWAYVTPYSVLFRLK